VDEGEFVAIMGQSGSGKSTLLSIIGGLSHPTKGSVFVDTLDVYGLTSEQRADFRSEYLGIVFQSFQLIPYLTVLENVKLPMAVTGIKDKEQQKRALQILERVGLESKAKHFPEGSRNGWPLPGPLLIIHPFCLPTNRRGTWTAKLRKV